MAHLEICGGGGTPGGLKGKPSDLENEASTRVPSSEEGDANGENSANMSAVDLGGAVEDVDDVFEEALRDVKVATVGNVDSGKSTLVGVLTKNILDDGRGLARSKVFNFSHEAANGRTSSIAQEIMGFSEKGDQVVSDRLGASSAASRNAVWQNIVAQSNKLVTFIDLCGHEKYLKTTIFGLVGLCPDYAMIIVNANAGFQKMSREHLGIALALRIPIIFVVTKIDMAPDNVYAETMSMLKKIVKSNAVKKSPLVIQGLGDLKDAAEGLAVDQISPIFCVSSVTGEGLPLLKAFLQRIPSRLHLSGLFRPATEPAEFHIDSVYTVTGVGVVVGGIMRGGTIRPNQQLLLGPDKASGFRPILVKTIHYKRSAADAAYSGQHCALALRLLIKKETLRKTSFRKGMVLVDAAMNPEPVWEFKAEVIVLHHATTIREKYQAMIHCGIIRQTARVVHMSADLLRTGDKAIVTFRFMFHAEFVREGATLLFREGRTKGLGRIVEASPLSASMAS